MFDGFSGIPGSWIDSLGGFDFDGRLDASSWTASLGFSSDFPDDAETSELLDADWDDVGDGGSARMLPKRAPSPVHFVLYSLVWSSCSSRLSSILCTFHWQMSKNNFKILIK